jgi:hypothetical protein
MRHKAIALALFSPSLAWLAIRPGAPSQEPGTDASGGAVEQKEDRPSAEPEFRAQLQRARQLLAEFERSRKTLLEPRGWLDPLLGYQSAPEPGVRSLSLALNALEPESAWQPRQALTFAADGRLEQVLSWSSLGPFEERVELRYDEQGRLRVREHHAEREDSSAPRERLLLEPLEAGWRSERFDQLGRLSCVEHWDGQGRLLRQSWPLLATTTLVAERDPGGRLLGIAELTDAGIQVPLIAVLYTPPIAQFSLWHRGEAIPFRMRIEGPADAGQTIDVELEPQGVRLELQQHRPTAQGRLEPTQLSLRVWQPPRRGSQPLFPRFEPVWLQRGALTEASEVPLEFQGGASTQRVELSASGEQPAEGALRLRETEFRGSLWTECVQERYSRKRQAWEPAGLKVKRDWSH